MKRSLGAKSLVYPTPVFVIGSYDQKGEPNIMTAAWAGICCSSPPAIGVSLRKATYTYGNIMERKAFTVNVLSQDKVNEIDFIGLSSGRDQDKFAAAGLSPVRSELVDAPYVQECPMVLECRLLRTVEIGLHTQFIGEIMDVKAEENTLDENGTCQMSKVRPLLFTPDERNYYGVGSVVARAFDAGRGVRPRKR